LLTSVYGLILSSRQLPRRFGKAKESTFPLLGEEAVLNGSQALIEQDGSRGSGDPCRLPEINQNEGCSMMREHPLRLYVAGDTVVSQKARENVQRLCERYTGIESTVIDVLTDPALADKARILATPTLVYDHPGRSKRVIGDLSDTERVIEFLGLQQRDEGP
jgi:circadian clock protein KaiB